MRDLLRIAGLSPADLAHLLVSSEQVRHRFAAAATIPVINALTDGHHPCQALADLLTLRQRFGELRGLKLAYLGDGNNVTHSLLEACAVAGIDIARRSGSLVTVTHDPLLAALGADAIYADVWLSMGDSDDEKATRTEALGRMHTAQALLTALVLGQLEGAAVTVIS